MVKQQIAIVDKIIFMRKATKSNYKEKIEIYIEQFSKYGY